MNSICLFSYQVASGKELTCWCRRHKRYGFDPWVEKIHLEEGKATHSSILAWRIPWTEEPGGLQSIGSLRVGHDWSDLAHTHAFFNEVWRYSGKILLTLVSFPPWFANQLKRCSFFSTNEIITGVAALLNFRLVMEQRKVKKKNPMWKHLANILLIFRFIIN